MRDVTRVIHTQTDDEENDRVQGTAHVVVTSCANGKSVSGDTNDDGIVNLNTKELTEDPDGVGTDKLKEWNFNATIQVTCDGYRTFETALVRVTRDFGLIVPMHPTDINGPYPHRVSFDEWDALYTKNEFLLAAGNTGDHTIQVVMHNVTSADPATIQFWVDDESTPRQSVQVAPDTSTKVVSASLKAPFLKKGDPQALPANTSFHVTMTQGLTTYSWPVSLAVFEGVFDAPSGKKKVTLKPFNTAGTSGTKLDIKWPSGVPLVGDGSLSFWTPSLPIDIYVNRFGYIQLTLKTPQWGYKNDNGANAGGKWGEFPATLCPSNGTRCSRPLKPCPTKRTPTRGVAVIGIRWSSNGHTRASMHQGDEVACDHQMAQYDARLGSYPIAGLFAIPYQHCGSGAWRSPV